MGRWAVFALVLALVGTGCSLQVDSRLPDPNGPVSDDSSAGGVESEARAGWESLYPAYQLMEGGRRWGYTDRTGSFAIAPQFESAAIFQPVGLALISQGEISGVINAKGKLIYSDTGIYSAVAAGSVMILEGGGKSIMLDAAGSVLFEAGWISDEFSDGLAPFQTDGLYGYVDSKDGSLSYVTPEGKTVWEASDSMPLVGGGEIREQKIRSGPFVLIRYPQVAGLSNREVQDKMNQRLREAFGWTPPDNEGDWGSTLDVNYTVEQIGRILVVQLDGYWYPAGAAHGMPSKEYFHFDLDTGSEYELRDLFKPGSAYQARLEKLVSERILAERPDLFTTEPSVALDHDFAVTVEGLVLYWYPYEIGPYSSGFPTFVIPWDDVSDLIDRDGTFWRGLGL